MSLRGWTLTWLLLQEGVAVPLLRSFVKGPRGSAEHRQQDSYLAVFQTDTHVPKVDLQLLGGIFSPLSLVLPSCQMYQSRLALSFELRLSLNQACCKK